LESALNSSGHVPRGWVSIRSWAPIAVVVGAALAWLWPIGLGGKMPLGGDVTSFSIGLMAVLRESLHAGRLPLWNDLWGYGFPGLAESQMGFFYPPHIVLYGLLEVERAYTASLVGHTLWGAVGAFWAARRFGVSPWGAALSAVAWTSCGFYVIHLPHQWGYTVGSWMPWAWGLAWTLAIGRGGLRTGLALAAVLAVQVLPGHFQLAFETQVGVLGIALWTVIERPRGWRLSGGSAIVLVVAWLAVGPLAAAQLWPTARLAMLAQSQRDLEYLSGFATTPLHLVSFVAPGLFHQSPLWRPLAWDPFHTSPEECLGYVGLVPLFLSFGAIRRLLARDAGVRALLILTIGSMVFSLGPYAPGFTWLCRLPGFSFFRAPARWDLATSLGLALLAGKGLDRLGTEWPRAGRSLAQFVVIALLITTVAVLAFEGVLASTEGAGWPAVSGTYDKILKQLPWSKDPSARDLARIARQPQADDRVQAGLARQGYRNVPRGGLRWDRERSAIYRSELGGTAILLLMLALLVPLSRRRTAFVIALGLVTGLDLLGPGRYRPIDFGPIRPLTEQSSVLARLSKSPRGERIAGPLSNLPMVSGVAPIFAYRTLDLPVVPGTTVRAQGSLIHSQAERDVTETLRVTGARIRILDSVDLARPSRGPTLSGSIELVEDRALASWLLGSDWIEGDGAWRAKFALWRPGVEGTRAWFVHESRTPRALEPIPANRDDAPVVSEVLAGAVPCTFRSDRPEHLRVSVNATGPGLVIVSELHDPEWRAMLRGPTGQTPVELDRIFGRPGAGAWQGIAVPSAGEWTIDLEYSGAAARQGMAVSGVAWGIWILAYWRLVRRGGRGVEPK
jgi:hypothetical protein